MGKGLTGRCRESVVVVVVVRFFFCEKIGCAFRWR